MGQGIWCLVDILASCYYFLFKAAYLHYRLRVYLSLRALVFHLFLGLYSISHRCYSLFFSTLTSLSKVLSSIIFLLLILGTHLHSLFSFLFDLGHIWSSLMKTFYSFSKYCNFGCSVIWLSFAKALKVKIHLLFSRLFSPQKICDYLFFLPIYLGYDYHIFYPID